ncbi:PTS transporter subunit EIIC [Gracilibacillus sp. YIM 98692]|uniref:PTS transporter subunit EIIC n=1 Tax=Gracilibacillus sp. YIM 98692 TaxID=2663532 RepID=UPI0013D19506|nr:PTS transporter subunit EIIC [Gracilibacillus sp. YIM 98692]
MAKKLVTLLGGKENIVTITHCTTRLRFDLRDESKVKKTEIEQMNDVHGTFTRLGLFQIILENDVVNKVYRAIMDMEEAPITKTPANSQSKKNLFIRFAETMSNIFIPIIPAIVASGLLLGLIGIIEEFQWLSPDHSFMKLLNIFSSSPFIILPILLGFSAAKEFGGNPTLGAVIGGILTHPALLNPSMVGHKIPEYIEVLEFDVSLISYQGTVIPILLSVFLMSKLEINLRKVVPQSLDLFIIPFLVILSIGSISLIAIGPFSSFISNIMTTMIELVYNLGGIISGLLFGGLYALIVITGLHHILITLEIELLSNIGVNFLLPIWSMANIAQGGAGLAVYFKTENVKLRKTALPTSLLAFLGIIEPVVFGINLKLIKPFIAAAIGGALGGAYIVLTQVAANSYGLTGIPMIAIVGPLGMTNLMHYLIGFVISAMVAFIASWILLRREENL